MATQVVLPTVMRALCGDHRKLPVAGETVAEALDHVVREFPAAREKLFDDQGNLLGFVNVFVNQNDIRDLSGLETVISERDEIVIVPALAGG